MRIAHLQACVLEWPSRLHGDPQGPSPLQARHPRVVRHRMPLVQLGVRVDDLRVLHQPVAEVVDDGGDGEDAAKTFIKSWFCHDFVLPWFCVLDRHYSHRYASREPTSSGIQAVRNLFSPTDGPSE